MMPSLWRKFKLTFDVWIRALFWKRILCRVSLFGSNKEFDCESTEKRETIKCEKANKTALMGLKANPLRFYEEDEKDKRFDWGRVLWKGFLFITTANAANSDFFTVSVCRAIKTISYHSSSSISSPKITIATENNCVALILKYRFHCHECDKCEDCNWDGWMWIVKKTLEDSYRKKFPITFPTYWRLNCDALTLISDEAPSMRVATALRSLVHTLIQI